MTETAEQTGSPHPNPSPEEEGLRRAAEMTSLDTSKRTNTPPLQGRGKGWGLSAARNAEIASYAHEMRRTPTDP